MNEPPDPYAPPKSVAEVSPAEERVWKGSRIDRVLRWVAAGTMGALVLQSVFNGSAMSLTKAISLSLWGGLGLGALLGGRRWHLGLAIFMLLCLGLQLWGLKVYLELERRRSGALPPVLLQAFVRSLGAYAVTLVCAVALYVRARRRMLRVES